MGMEKYDKDTKKAVGRGAFGVVYLYIRKEDRREVIIKQISADDLSTEQRKGVMNEIEVSAMFNHPNIIKYHEYFSHENNFMIVMDYAPGGNLFDYLQQRQTKKMLLGEDEILKFFAQIARALYHIHQQNILHRDMKTHNILLDRRKKVIKICDFGIAKFLTKTNALTTVGTAHYMSPEVIEGKSYNKKSDIWSLGCILYELITLRRAFDGDSLSSILQKIIKRGFSSMSEHYSEEIRDLVNSILQTDPVKRYDVNEILAQPVLINALLDLETDIGRVPCLYNYDSYQSKKAVGKATANNSTGGGHSEVYRTESFTSWGDEASKVAAEQQSVVFCWGGNLYTQPTILPTSGIDQFVKQICAGKTKRLGLTSNGRVLAWENNFTTLGGGGGMGESEQLVPRLLGECSGTTVAKVCCGDTFVALMTVRGMLMTWGSGVNGCLGHGNTEDLSSASLVNDLAGSTVTSLACGASHVMCLTVDNLVYVWGKGTSEFGDQTSIKKITAMKNDPEREKFLRKKHLVVFSCDDVTDVQKKCRLGLNDLNERLSPALVPLPAEVVPKAIFCGANCSFIVTQEGKVLACGNNRDNKLGVLTEQQLKDPSNIPSDNDVMVFTPVTAKPIGEQRVSHVASGSAHTVFLTESGMVFTCGSNKYQQLGRQAVGLRGAAIKLPERVEMAGCGDTFTVVVTRGNRIFVWGSGKHGRLGLGSHVTTAEHAREVTIKDLPTVHSVSVSYNGVLLAAHVG